MKLDTELPANSVMVRAMSTVPSQVNGTLLGVDAASIRLSVPFFLPPATQISMKFSESCQAEGEVACCERQAERYCLTASFHPACQWAARLATEYGEIVGVGLFGAESGDSFRAVALSNLTNGNLVINCPRPIAPTRQIRVDVRDGIMFGVVKCCTFIGPWNRVTVAIEKTVFRSDSLRFLRFVLADLRRKRSQIKLWLYRGAFWQARQRV